MFTEGSVPSPDIDWSLETAEALGLLVETGRQEDGFACYRAAWEHSATQLAAIFLPVDPSGGPTSGTSAPGGPVFVEMGAWGGWDHTQGILSTTAHEIGHALYDWPHTDLDCVCLDKWSVMNRNTRCYDPSNQGLGWDVPLGTYHVVCWQRTMAGWPLQDLIGCP